MKQEEIKRQAHNLTNSLQKKGGEMDSRVEEAVCKVIETILPRLEGEPGQEGLLQNLDRLTEWINKMPRSLHPGQRWNREEFSAVLAGPAEENDPRFEDYMDAFYEEYLGNQDNEVYDFYDKLFQNEQQIGDVDWLSVWESVRSSYENWLESAEEDEWLRGEKTEKAGQAAAV